MGKKSVTIIFAFMITLGVFGGLIFCWITMSLTGNSLVPCVIMGGILGLIYSCITLVVLKKYLDEKFRNQKLDSEIRKDKLTELYNRYAFDNDIRRLNSEEVHSMIFLDVDNFKDYNNIYGHQAGDKILLDCAGIIKSSIRVVDFAYRYGGEEFVVVLPGCSKKEAEKIAQKIVENISENDISPYPSMTISAGVAAIPEDVHSFDQLIRVSDLALLQAKKNGKNQEVVYDEFIGHHVQK